MKKDEINRLLNEEHDITMDGCAMLVAMMAILEKMCYDEEIGPLLNDNTIFEVNEDEELSVHGRMLISAGAYIATAASEVFGEQYVRDLIDGSRGGTIN